MTRFRNGERVRVTQGREQGRKALVVGRLQCGYVRCSFLDEDFDAPCRGIAADHLERVK